MNLEKKYLCHKGLTLIIIMHALGQMFFMAFLFYCLEIKHFCNALQILPLHFIFYIYILLFLGWHKFFLLSLYCSSSRTIYIYIYEEKIFHGQTCCYATFVMLYNLKILLKKCKITVKVFPLYTRISCAISIVCGPFASYIEFCFWKIFCTKIPFRKIKKKIYIQKPSHSIDNGYGIGTLNYCKKKGQWYSIILRMTKIFSTNILYLQKRELVEWGLWFFVVLS